MKHQQSVLQERNQREDAVLVVTVNYRTSIRLLQLTQADHFYISVILLYFSITGEGREAGCCYYIKNVILI